MYGAVITTLRAWQDEFDMGVLDLVARLPGDPVSHAAVRAGKRLAAREEEDEDSDDSDQVDYAFDDGDFSDDFGSY